MLSWRSTNIYLRVLENICIKNTRLLSRNLSLKNISLKIHNCSLVGPWKNFLQKSLFIATRVFMRPGKCHDYSLEKNLKKTRIIALIILGKNLLEFWNVPWKKIFQKMRIISLMVLEKYLLKSQGGSWKKSFKKPWTISSKVLGKTLLKSQNYILDGHWKRLPYESSIIALRLLNQNWFKIPHYVIDYPCKETELKIHNCSIDCPWKNVRKNSGLLHWASMRKMLL